MTTVETLKTIVWPKVKLGPALVQRISWWMTGWFRYHVTFLGPPAAGKSQIGISVQLSNKVADHSASKGLVSQYQSFVVGAAKQSPPVTPSEAATSAFLEYIDVQTAAGSDLRMVFVAAEQFLADANDNKYFQTLERLARRGTVAVVLNPFAVDPHLAERALVGHISFVQRKHDLPFTRAMIESAATLFGIGTEAKIIELTAMRPSRDPASPAQGTLLEALGVPNADLIKVVADEPENVKSPRTFTYHGCPDAEGRVIELAIRRLSRSVVDRQRPLVNKLSSWLARDPSTFLLIFTRRDLIEEIDQLTQDDFDSACSKWTEQQALKYDQTIRVGLLQLRDTYLINGETRLTRDVEANRPECNRLVEWIVEHVGTRAVRRRARTTLFAVAASLIVLGASAFAFLVKYPLDM